jgi:prepilin-type N-terminal cleavage/methylation domain-containing protein
MMARGLKAIFSGYFTSRFKFKGVTLLEMSVALSILGLAVSLVGTSVFQVLAVQQTWQEDSVATKDLRHAESWFAGDALNTKTTDLVDGAGQVDSMMLTTWNGNEITYGVTDNKLQRSEFDGVQTVVTEVADDVVFVGFSLAARVVNFQLEVNADKGTTNTVSLQSYLR